MNTYSNIPWPKINDYLAELGTVNTIDEFADRALENISRLLPFDANAMFVNTDETGKVRSWKTVVDSNQWLNPFNSYYYRIMPDVNGQDIVSVDWNKYQNKEYTNDFIRPQGLRYTIGVFRLGYKINTTAVLTVHRTKNSHQFNDREQTICAFLQPHLVNLFTLISKLNHPNNYSLSEFILSNHQLSKREAEVAVLLYQLLNTSEIAAKLMISPRTVEFHIANIYEKLKVKTRRELLLKLAGKK